MAMRVLYSRMLIALLALLGLFDSAYLTLEHYSPKVALVCPIGGGCETVQASRWSTLPPGGGIPVALFGLVGYGAIVLLALASLQRERLGPLTLAPALVALGSIGVLFSLYLTALQVFVIGALCAWCLGSAAIELVIWLAALAGWRAGARSGEEARPGGARSGRVRRVEAATSD
jgi:uncharacterized membrane protein